MDFTRMHGDSPIYEERMIAGEMFDAMPPILHAIEKMCCARGVDIPTSEAWSEWFEAHDLYQRDQWFRLAEHERKRRLKQFKSMIVECDTLYHIEDDGYATYRDVRLFSYARISYSNLLDEGMDAFLESEAHRLRVKAELGA